MKYLKLYENFESESEFNKIEEVECVRVVKTHELIEFTTKEIEKLNSFSDNIECKATKTKGGKPCLSAIKGKRSLWKLGFNVIKSLFNEIYAVTFGVIIPLVDWDKVIPSIPIAKENLRSFYTVYKFEDDWFILVKYKPVKGRFRDGDIEYYKCDQLEGLKSCLLNGV